MTDFYTTIPALKTYIDRVGAKEKNFRRYIIKEDFGPLYRELCVIKLERDGTIECSDDRYAPDATERAKIKLALESVELPSSIETRPAGVQDLRTILRERGHPEPRHSRVLQSAQRHADHGAASGSRPIRASATIRGPTGATVFGDRWSRTAICRSGSQSRPPTKTRSWCMKAQRCQVRAGSLRPGGQNSPLVRRA